MRQHRRLSDFDEEEPGLRLGEPSAKHWRSEGAKRAQRRGAQATKRTLAYYVAGPVTLPRVAFLEGPEIEYVTDADVAAARRRRERS